MYITLLSLIKDPVMKDAKVLAMEELLESRIIRGVQILEGADAWKSVNYSEIVFISGIGMESPEADLIGIVQKLQAKNAVLVLRTGKYLKTVPQPVIAACAQYQVILLAIDSDVNMQTITRRMYELLFSEENRRHTIDHLIKRLIKGDYSNEEAEEIYRMGFSTEQYHIAVMICIDNYFDFREKEGNKKYLSALQVIRDSLSAILKKKKQTLTFCSIDSGMIYALLDNQSAYTNRRLLVDIFLELQESIAQLLPDITFSVGIGTPFSQLSYCTKSIKEAKRTLQIAYVCNKTKVIRCYDDIGIYRLLFELQDQEEFERIRDGIFGRLMASDADKNENLLKTLETYLDCDRNIGEAAQQLFLHRNTLKYRLNKIEEILLCDLSDVNTCFNLRLGFKINKFLQSEKMSYSSFLE